MTPEEKLKELYELFNSIIDSPYCQVVLDEEENKLIKSIDRTLNNNRQPSEEVDGSKELRIAGTSFESEDDAIEIFILDCDRVDYIPKSELPTLINWLKKQL